MKWILGSKINLLFKLHEYEQIVSGSETRIQEAVKKVTAAETAMENMKIHCNEEVQKVTEHSKQLSEQNSLLHKEIEKVARKDMFSVVHPFPSIVI